MGFRNGQTAMGVQLVSASTSPVNYVGLDVLATGDITFTDGKGNSTALTGVPAGARIDSIITKVTVCTATVLGYQA